MLHHIRAWAFLLRLFIIRRDRVIEYASVKSSRLSKKTLNVFMRLSVNFIERQKVWGGVLTVLQCQDLEPLEKETVRALLRVGDYGVLIRLTKRHDVALASDEVACLANHPHPTVRWAISSREDVLFTDKQIDMGLMDADERVVKNFVIHELKRQREILGKRHEVDLSVFGQEGSSVAAL
jgi:hypothetical protein